MDITESFRPEDLSKTDFFDFVTGPELTMNVDRSHGHTENTSDSIVEQPLQGFDQFWGPDKDTNKIESTMFEDLNRFNWNPSNAQNTNVIPNNQNANTDGQIYTITVLNGSTETWMRKDCVENPNPSLELDTILGNFSNYNVKSECFPYENTAYCNDDKDSLQIQLQQQQQQQTQNSNDIGSQLSNITILDSNGNNTGLNGSNNVSYQCNGNLNWQMNVSEGSSSHSSESFLRSALQGKGYGKGVHGTATSQILPSIKQEDDVRQILFNNDPDSLIYGDTALTAPMFEEHSVESPGSQQATPSSTTATGVVVDDMFLSLENFSEDYEKIKRIATEVQQFCADNNNYGGVSDIINPPSAISRISNVNSASATKLNQSIHASSEITTSNSASNLHLVHNSSVNRTKPSKKYKRTTTNNNNTSISNLNNSIITTNNNNNNNQSNTNSNNATASPVHLNGQRKERSLHYCSICSKGFKDKYSVNVHIRTHTGEKPFACSLCGKSFRQKAHLAKHYQTHLAQKNGSGNMKNKGGNHQNPRSTQTPSSTLQNTPQSQAPLQIQLNQTPILITTPGQVTVVASR